MLASRLSSAPCRAVRPFAPVRRGAPVTVAKFSTASLVQELSKDQLKPHFPAIQVGDTVKIGLAVKEANGKTRTQTLEGVIIGEHGSGINRTITFRRLFQGIGLELVLHTNSPVLLSADLVRRGRSRRAKLNYLRERLGKAAKLKEIVAGKNSTTNAVNAIKAAAKAAAAAASTA